MNGGELSPDEGGVRNDYLDLLQKIRLQREDLLEDKSRLEELINTSNMLFRKIKTSSELKLDAKMNALWTKLAWTRMEKDIDLEDITSSTFVELFRKSLLDDFYRYAMKCNAGMKFLNCFSLVFSEEAPSRKRSQVQRSRQHLPAAEIPVLITREKDSTEESGILMQIRRLVSERDRIEYFRLVINPESFSKTIENIFYLSLSLRSGFVSMEYDDGILYAISKTSEEGEIGHLAVEMTYDEYLEIIENTGISKPLIKS
ncbi:uncharacterized protein Eint_081770 [Encephalitozoon intestinalis ATCC 50506]|uniref:Non-structural maintenance of chromosomes element 4 n=1 Tax=Encephalitozoon intestinalis (strain ATCC 50506) TaxID=876142 RepID=E0S8A3_ENCIT|nr:uncharacterized protein Eint_081770 [Encephalitozoon intestinalis ATCC 50506]ADM12109.2 hypothetical protein Eint_081770 [Encephalitozoon intestinalis ATCC 50506]UTX45901.1 Nse4 C-terminal domain-containing protein [Encephalitozoon intestinalis]